MYVRRIYKLAGALDNRVIISPRYIDLLIDVVRTYGVPYFQKDYVCHNKFVRNNIKIIKAYLPSQIHGTKRKG